MTIPKSINKFSKIAFLPLALVHVIILENLVFTLWPEMVVYPYLVNNGFILYKDLINPYPPTLILALSAITKIFAYNPNIFQIITWILIFATDIILYFVTLKIVKSTSTALTSFIFFLTISIPFGINGLWFDLFQTPFIILSVFYFYNYFQNNKSNNLNLSMILAFLAILIKQQAIWLLFTYIALLVINSKSNVFSLILKLLPFVSLLLATVIIISTYLIANNSFNDFINWAVIFPFFKASQLPGYISLPTLKQIALVGLIFLICLPSIRLAKSKTYLIFAIALSLLLFAYPRFDMFHLVPALAVLSILFGLSVKAISGFGFGTKTVFTIFLILALITTIRFVVRNYSSEIRFFEPEIHTASTFIAISTQKDDLLYIQNGPDQVLPLSSRLPIKPWADEFSWYLENNQLQEKIVDALISQNPKYLIYKPYSQGKKFDLGVYRPTKIADYLDTSYKDVYPISQSLWLKEKI